MREMTSFQLTLKEILDDIGPDVLSYDESEFWMIERLYIYVEYYAQAKLMPNTLIALPLVRGLHDGVHRKATITRDGVTYRLPYVIHCLRVCRMLIDLRLPITKDEEDIVLAAALCHDLIEDIPFPNGGRELTTKFHMDPRVYMVVKHLSKRKDFTEEQHKNYFKTIQEDRLALLVKLADRGNNVEDLYNMSIWKTHEYVDETRTCFFPMCRYAKAHYPELDGEIQILYEKMYTLTQIGEILVTRYEEQESQLQDKLDALTRENEELRKVLHELDATEVPYGFIL